MLESWRSGSKPCPGQAWDGITCGDVQLGRADSKLKWNVIGLDVSSIQLRGQIDGDVSKLAALTYLTTLNLHGTPVVGDVSELSALRKLTYLDLGGKASQTKKVTGDVTKLAVLVLLTHLDLSHTAMTGDASKLGSLSQLVELDLSGTGVNFGGAKGMPEEQVAALVAFKNSGSTGSKAALSTWSDGSHPCPESGHAWAGVTCGSVKIGKVTETGLLWNLTNVDLSEDVYAAVDGDVACLATLTDLKGLNLGNTAATGDASKLDVLPHLTQLNLSGTSVTDGGKTGASDAMVAALLDFKESGSREARDTLSTWTAKGNPCSGTWFGISCGPIKIGQVADTGLLWNVVGLDLHDTTKLRLVDGDILKLAPLKDLETLNLFGTQVTGNVGSLVQYLPKLETLIVSHTLVTGGSGTPAEQVEALLAFKSSGSGNIEMMLGSWVAESDPCVDSWIGVLCTPGPPKRIKKQTFPQTEISTLSFLSVERKEQVNGDVEELANLVQLQHLNLAGTAVTGDASKLGSLSQLVELDLSGTGVNFGGAKGMPEEQVAALVAFKNSGSTGSKAALSTWSDGSHPCPESGHAWAGVTCGSVKIGKVTETGLLWNLTNVDLSEDVYAAVDGDVACLATLTDLKGLNLGNTAATGDASKLDVLPHLTQLNLSGTSVTDGGKTGASDAMVAALLDFKESGSREARDTLSTWTAKGNPCPGTRTSSDWLGVSCGPFNIAKVDSKLLWNIIGLDLSGASVDGDVENLSGLLDLQSLTLTDTAVRGEVETLLAGLVHLSSLNLTGTSLRIMDTIGGTPNKQVAALSAFKASGHGGAALQTWTKGVSPCVKVGHAWIGITCEWNGGDINANIPDGSTRKSFRKIATGLVRYDVTGLDLHSASQLEGDVTTLEPLLHLESLDLSGTSVTGWPLVVQGGREFRDPTSKDGHENDKNDEIVYMHVVLGMIGLIFCFCTWAYACFRRKEQKQTEPAAEPSETTPSRCGAGWCRWPMVGAGGEPVPAGGDNDIVMISSLQSGLQPTAKESLSNCTPATVSAVSGLVGQQSGSGAVLAEQASAPNLQVSGDSDAETQRIEIEEHVPTAINRARSETNGAQGTWYRVSDGGQVAFRYSPEMDNRSGVTAVPGEMIFAPPLESFTGEDAIEAVDGWICTEMSMWLPLSLLIHVPENVPVAVQERARTYHRLSVEQFRHRTS
eukprot:SAG22_NODE_129_length_18679_cov_40.656028_20_plen_1194_part_00